MQAHRDLHNLNGSGFKRARIQSGRDGKKKEETLIVPVEGERRSGNRSSEQRRENRQRVNNT